MAGQTDLESGSTGNTPVPDLIERYKLRRDAWIAQADELARLRDEVRGSAEREALEIVTAARRDVRRVIMEARRELLVLSAQVQAALGESTPKNEPPALLPHAGADITTETVHKPALTSGPSPIALVPEAAVDEILNEVRADMTALAEDARALPLQPIGPVHPIVVTETPSVPVEDTDPAPLIVTSSATSSVDSSRPDFADSPYFAAATPVEGAKPWLPSWFPSHAVPVHADRRAGVFVAAFATVGVVVGATTLWWLLSRGPEEPSSTADAGASAAPTAAPSTAKPAEAIAETSKTASAPAIAPGKLLVVAEAVRDVWVRTTIDGRVGEGQTLAAGQVVNLTADRSISLRVGDAGAMRVSVNRGESQVLGGDGQVVTRDYVVNGARPQEGVARPPVDATTEPPRSPPIGPPTAVASPTPFPSATEQPAAIAVNPPPATPVPPPAAAPPSPPVQAVAPPTPAPTNQVASTAPPASTPATGQATPLTAPPAPSPSNTSGLAPAPSVASMVVAAARQWLDAYHRQDQAAMAALSTDNLLLADERGAEERFPAGAGNVTRTLDRVNVQVAADTAVLTAVMMEQTGAQPPRVSPISQVWVLAGAGQWKVRQARFVSEARLNQVFR